MAKKESGTPASSGGPGYSRRGEVKKEELPGKGMKDTQVQHGSGVVNQTPGHSLDYTRRGQVKGNQMPGRNLKNTQTRNSSGVVDQSSARTKPETAHEHGRSA